MKFPYSVKRGHKTPIPQNKDFVILFLGMGIFSD